MKCNSCGNENSDKAKFCGGCGNKLLQGGAPNIEINSSTIPLTEIIPAQEKATVIKTQPPNHLTAFAQSREFPGGTITCRAYIGTVHDATTFSSSNTYGSGGGATVGGYGGSSMKVQTEVTEHHHFWVRIHDSDQDVQFKLKNSDFMVANGQTVVLTHAHSISNTDNDSGESFCYIINKSNGMKFKKLIWTEFKDDADLPIIGNLSRPLLSSEQATIQNKRIIGFIASPVAGLILAYFSGILGLIACIGGAIFTQINFKDNSVRDTLQYIDWFRDKAIQDLR